MLEQSLQCFLFCCFSAALVCATRFCAPVTRRNFMLGEHVRRGAPPHYKGDLNAAQRRSTRAPALFALHKRPEFPHATLFNSLHARVCECASECVCVRVHSNRAPFAWNKRPANFSLGAAVASVKAECPGRGFYLCRARALNRVSNVHNFWGCPATLCLCIFRATPLLAPQPPPQVA